MIATIPADTECYARSTIHDRARATRRWLTLLAAATVALAPASAFGQQAFPYRWRTGWDVAFTVGGLAMFATDVVRSQNVVEPLTPEKIQSLDPQRIGKIDRFATRQYSTAARKASDVLLWTMLVAPLTLMATEPGNDDPLLIGAMYAEAQLFQSGLVFMLKSLVTRTRPFVYNNNPAIPPESKLILFARRSFPSAHASTAFTSAVFLGSVNARLNPGSSANAWVWAGSLTAAGLTGYFRILGGQHFPTDVLAGAAIGALTGWIVPALHKQETTEGGADTRIAIPLASLRF